MCKDICRALGRKSRNTPYFFGGDNKDDNDGNDDGDDDNDDYYEYKNF